MRRWMIPVLFLAAAVGTGTQACHAVLAARSHADAPEVLLALCAWLRTIVAVAFAAFTVNRADPHRRSRDPLAWAACGAAMVTLVALAAPARGTPPPLLAAGDAVAVCGCLWQLASVLVLGRCFGILPEARGLVRRGPYRLVRHPVYLGEITAVTGLTLAVPVPGNIACLGNIYRKLGVANRAAAVRYAFKNGLVAA